MLLVRQGNWKDAERIARSAGVEFGNAYATTLGEIFANVGAFEEAEQCLHRALDANARDAVALTYLGSVHAHQKKLAEALACIDAALAIAPDFRTALNVRQSVAFLVESAKKARATLEDYARRKGLDAHTVDITDIEFLSALTNHAGTPAFTLSLPGSLIINDLGAAILFREEVTGRGWEFPLRKFLITQLRSDDVFIDVGAHWGIHSLTAATTRWSNQVSVLAIEAHPQNAERLRAWVARNGVGDTVEVISVALGDAEGIARLRLDGSSMGHSLSNADKLGSPTIEVRVMRLDQIMAARPNLQWRRVFLKIDVEGYEYEVLSGGRQLLGSGNVAAVVWENGAFDNPQARFERRKSILDIFDSHGFAHYHFDENTSRLAPLATLDDAGDVYSLSPELRLTFANEPLIAS
jgi:FkbM family methyltransferase